jgi:hypothetical protein
VSPQNLNLQEIVSSNISARSIPLSDHVHLAALRIAEGAGGFIDEYTQVFSRTTRTEFDPPAALIELLNRGLQRVLFRPERHREVPRPMRFANE